MPDAFKPNDFASIDPPSWGQQPSKILRAAQSPYTKSPYALEHNPWVSREEWETLLLLRGIIVASFGQIETTLAELALRLSRDQDCSSLLESYPYAIEKRLKFLRKCFKFPRYNRRAGLAEQIFKRFESTSDLRHVMAHGRINGPTMGWFLFRDFKPTGNSEVQWRDHRFTIYDLEMHAYRSARLARQVQHLSAKATAFNWFPAM